jgi:hypothetical protein
MFVDYWDVLACHLEGRYRQFRGTVVCIFTVVEEGTGKWYRLQELGLQDTQ